ncbi:hypothetical protein CLOSTHATH_07130 [Hungatella hathewayi DSM 13479]|uniref:Uncharacterized protein n=1 Tax=Hungatella hathewayi DSM 13479 TaxID=566550 RepID=D3AU16_9FIRM|nr:hypothetical protein CLOSTHATH_07130 [Hungatella hathewayi DSM 13479]
MRNLYGRTGKYRRPVPFLFSTFIQAAGKETGSGICEAPPPDKGD